LPGAASILAFDTPFDQPPSVGAQIDMTRPFGLWTATALVVGGMIGSGIFFLPAQLAPFGWTGVVAWFCVIAGSGVVALVLSRLAARMPQATGAVAMCAAALGPVAGVLIGSSYWVGVWSANAIIAVTAIRYLAVFVPWLAATEVSAALSAIALIWLITLLNVGGARAAGRFQVVTTVLKILPLLAVVAILGQLMLSGHLGLHTYPHSAFSGASLTPAATLAFFALVGFEGASLVAERVRDPARNLVRATLGGLFATGLLYLILCAGIVFAMPADTIAAANAPVALFVATYWGQGAGIAVAAFAAIAVIGCLNGWVLVQGELPLGMARAGVLPRWLDRTNERDVPVAILVGSSALASVLIVSTMSRSTEGILAFMLQLTTAATIWLYIGVCTAALKIGIARPGAVIGLLFSCWVMIGAGWEAIGWSILLMACALPLYWLRDAVPVAQPA
jgi:APA family basic amino acid/polyamine antiporter